MAFPAVDHSSAHVWFLLVRDVLKGKHTAKQTEHVGGQLDHFHTIRLSTETDNVKKKNIVVYRVIHTQSYQLTDKIHRSVIVRWFNAVVPNLT